MAFNIGLSGLNAAAKGLEVTGNNIANVATTGFKESRAEFSEVFNSSALGIACSASGSGVRVNCVVQQFRQGNIDQTGNPLDLAINGEGFFALRDGENGPITYTRGGGFQLDSDRFVVDGQNRRLQVYPVVSDPFTEPHQFNVGRGGLSDLQLPVGESEPRATTSVAGTINLNAASAIPPAADDGIVPGNPDTFNFQTSLTVYDSQGGSHTALLYFQKEEANTWQVGIRIEGIPDDFDPEEALDLVYELEFGPNGLLTDEDGEIINAADELLGQAAIEFGDPENGADEIEFTLDLSDATQFASPFVVNQITQDGFASGRLSNIGVDPSGIVFAQYTNGRSEALGQVAMAVFENPQGLQQLGSTWAESFASGGPTFDQADTGRFGKIESGALEASNVELTEQLVKLITSQRNFQANAQVISAADTITQTVINIR